MKHSFLLAPPPCRLNQPFDGESGGGGGVVSEMTRRKFLKRTGGATLAGFLALKLSSTSANATEDNSTSSASFRWILRCTADPLTGTSNEEAKRLALFHSVLNPSGGGFYFETKKDTGFDPPGPGDASNCKLRCELAGEGPKIGEEGTSMSVVGLITAFMTVRDTHRLYLGPADGAAEGIDHVEDEIASRTITVKINSRTGAVSWVPIKPPGSVSSGDSGHWTLGYSEASYTNSGTFSVTGSASHTFNSAYSGEVSASAKATFKVIFEVDFSASLAIDLNNLGTIHANPDSLLWVIKKVKQLVSSGGQVISEEEFELDYAEPPAPLP